MTTNGTNGIEVSSKNGTIDAYKSQRLVPIRTKAEEPSNARSGRMTKAIPLDSIWMVKPSRPRDSIDEESVQGLAKSIETLGLIQAIVVERMNEPNGTRPYRLLAGERRLTAHVMLGRKEIDATIVGTLDDETREDIAWHENVEREQLSIWDFYREIILRRERRPDEKPARMAERTDLSAVFIEDCFSISDYAAPELVAVLRADARSETFRHLAQASRIIAPTESERHALQRSWWQSEGWRSLPKRGGKRGPRARVRMSEREIEKLARRIEDERIVESGGERVELGAKAARVVADLLRRTIAPPGGKRADGAGNGPEGTPEG